MIFSLMGKYDYKQSKYVLQSSEQANMCLYLQSIIFPFPRLWLLIFDKHFVQRERSLMTSHIRVGTLGAQHSP